jgi:hypothetical protein
MHERIVRQAFFVFLAARPEAPPWDRAAVRVQRAKEGCTRNAKSETNALEVDAVTCFAWPSRLGNWSQALQPKTDEPSQKHTGKWC